MGKKTRVIEWLVDDLTGEELPEGEGHTLAFALDGRAYEIDLSEENAEHLRAFLAPYVEKGRRAADDRRTVLKAPRQAAPPAVGKKTELPITGRTAERLRTGIRAWANENGYEQARTGKIKDDVFAAYYAAHPDAPDIRPANLRVSA